MNCEKSRKHNCLKQIQISRCRRMSLDEVLKSTRGYMDRTVGELEDIWHEEFINYPPEKRED
jgi:hypothetical protein